VTEDDRVDFFTHRPYERYFNVSHEDLSPMFFEATMRGRLEEDEEKNPVLILKAPQNVRDWFIAAAGFREEYETNAEAREVIETARGLEGLRRQDSIHAAAVVISPMPLQEIVPVQQKGDEAEVVTQYEMHGVEALGLLKMDFLGLRNLATIERALELIERTTGERVDIDAIPLDDPKVFAMLQEGDSMGVFQFEGGPMRALMRNLKPEVFEHLVALNALYRPGPLGAGMHNEFADRKNGRSPVEYLHPSGFEGGLSRIEEDLIHHVHAEAVPQALDLDLTVGNFLLELTHQLFLGGPQRR